MLEKEYMHWKYKKLATEDYSNIIGARTNAHLLNYSYILSL